MRLFADLVVKELIVVKNVLNYKSQKVTNFINLGLALGLGVMSSFSAYANTQGFKGFKLGSKEDPYWLTVNGGLKIDQRLFSGDKRDDLHSGASIRELSLDLASGMGKDISVSLGLGFNSSKSQVEIDDAFVTYSGYKGFGENFHVSVGKVRSTFCLENHTSGKWIPFLERSSVTTAFNPDSGLGFSVNKWQHDYSINASITQPKPNSVTTDEKGNTVQGRDRFQYNARLTKAHFFGENKLIEGGIFGHYKDNGGNGLEFSSGPEAKSRHATNMLLNTTINPTGSAGSKTMIKAKDHYTIGAEILGQDGPLSGEIEYQHTRVHRDKIQSGNNPTFKGYRSNINYVLTGESRSFKPCNGTLGQVIPNSDSGAWEISARYDFLNLNNKDVRGGAAHHLGLAATWYVNYNFAVTGEFVRSNIVKQVTLDKLKINSIGARLQLVF